MVGDCGLIVGFLSEWVWCGGERSRFPFSLAPTVVVACDGRLSRCSVLADASMSLVLVDVGCVNVLSPEAVSC